MLVILFGGGGLCICPGDRISQRGRSMWVSFEGGCVKEVSIPEGEVLSMPRWWVPTPSGVIQSPDMGSGKGPGTHSILLTSPKHVWYTSCWNVFLSALMSFLLSFFHSEPDCGIMGVFDWCIYGFKRRALRVSDAGLHKHICDQLPWCNYILATHFNLH